MTYIVIGEDKRYKLVAEELKSLQKDVHHFQNYSDFEQSTSFTAPIHLLLLPIGFSEPSKNIKLPDHISHIWSGTKYPIDHAPSSHYLTYTEDEDWLWKNADLTAECTLKWLFEHLPRKVSAYSYEIAGFGRVAKCVANKLQTLNSEVTIRTRSSSQTAEAKQFGFKTAHLSEPLSKGSICINTIPAPWLSKKMIHEDCHVIDLASLPGGLIEPLDVPYDMLLALPGKMYPVEAAMDFIYLMKRKGILTD